MTIQDSLDHQRIRRVLHVGRALVEGPRALFPPAALDDFGWLEPYLRIELSSSGLEVSRSIAIYTDSTMNRDDGFLAPVVRHAVWQQGQDRNNAPLWPSIDITLGHFEVQRQEVERLVLAVQTIIQRIPFVSTGLSTDQRAPDLAGEYMGLLNLYVANGAQFVAIGSSLRSEDALSAQALSTFDALKGAMESISRTGWRERYDADLNGE